MRELRDILALWAELRGRGEGSVLVTVVGVKGSAYRRPGARMLIAGDGRAVGMVSGHCLEGDLVQRARRVMATGEPELAAYDASSPYDALLGYGLGCGGVIEVLLEPVRAPGAGAFLREAAGCLEARQPLAAATVLRSDGDAGAHVGARLLLGRSPPLCQVEEPSLAQALFERLRAFSAASATGAAGRCELGEGRLDALLETVGPPVHLVAVGAGADAVPLARAGLAMGWDVTVADDRPAYAVQERFPDGAKVVLREPGESVRAARPDRRTALVLMTHHFLRDLEALREALDSEASYIGVIGPERRTRELLARLGGDGPAPSDEALGRLYGPAGLDLGGEAPEAIALSIAAEVLCVMAGRKGGCLRDKEGPIHG